MKLSNRPKFTLIDLLSFSHSHLNINSFWVKEIGKRNSVEIIAEREHTDHLQADRQVEAVRKVSKGRGWRIKREVLFPWYMMTRKRTPVLIMGATGIQVLTMAILERCFPRRAQGWAIVLHSELEGVQANARGISKKACGLALKTLRFPKNSSAIVLGEHVKRNLAALGLNTANMISIEHPLPEPETLDWSPFESKDVRVAMIGLIRGDSKDLELASEVGSEPNITVSAIGRAGPDFKRLPNIEYVLAEGHYPDSWISDQLSTIDAILVCPKADSYMFTASGTAADGLKYGKPTLWVKHPSLSAYEASPIAICADSAKQLASKVKTYELPSAEKVNNWVTGWNDECRRKFYLLESKLIEKYQNAH